MEKESGGVAIAMTRPASYRWLQLFMGIVCMAMIANLQYGWTLFVNPISERHGWTRAAIQGESSTCSRAPDGRQFA